MNPTDIPNRCRLVLIAPKNATPQRVVEAFSGGDVASLILPQWDMADDAFQAFAEAVVPAAQEAGAAVMVAGDTRIAARARADGIHLESDRATLEDMIAKHQDRLMVGAGGATTRDDALELGEARPDYMFFGRFGYDTKPEPHPRNLKLGQWWAEMVQIPCIVMGGSDIDQVVVVAQTGAEFVALSEAVFGGDTEPSAAIARINDLLDAQAPRFGD